MMDTSVYQEYSMISQDSSSSDQEMEVQSPQFFSPSTSQPQSFEQPIFMPYIKGSKMDWTLNDSLFHRLLKWKLNCEIFLIVNLPYYLNHRSGRKS